MYVKPKRSRRCQQLNCISFFAFAIVLLTALWIPRQSISQETSSTQCGPLKGANLEEAVDSGDLFQIKCAIAQGFDFNALGYGGYSLLWSSLFSENYEVSKLLLDAGADPNLGRFLPLPTVVNKLALTSDRKRVLSREAETMYFLLLDFGADNDIQGDGGGHLTIDIIYSLCNAPAVGSKRSWQRFSESLKRHPLTLSDPDLEKLEAFIALAKIERFDVDCLTTFLL